MALDPLNSAGGFSTGIPANTIIQANGQITTTKGANITGNISLGNIASGTANIKILGGGNGQILGTDANGNLLFQSRIDNGTANLVINTDGNIAISAGNVANVGVFYKGTGAGNSGLIVNNNLEANGNLQVDGDATIDGNLNVNGNTNFTNVNNLAISDVFINLAVNGDGGPLVNTDNYDRGTLMHFFGANLVTTTTEAINISGSPGNTVTVTDLTNVAVGQAVYGNTLSGNAIFPLTAVVANVDLANLQFSANANLISNVDIGDQVVFGSDQLTFTGYDKSTNSYVFASNVSVTNNIVTYANANLMNVKAGTVSAILDGNIVRGLSNVIVNTDGNIDLNVPAANSINIAGNANSEIKLTVGANGNVSLTGNANSNINISGGANSNFVANVTNIDFKTAGIPNISLGVVGNLHIDGGATTAATLGTITLNANGTITNIAIGSGGSGYDIAPTITITGANTAIAEITTTISSGAVSTIVIGNGGRGYDANTIAANITAPGIKYLKTDGAGNLAWREVNASGSSGGGAATDPAGANTQVQFNDNGSFGANANFTYNKTTRTLSVPNISANGSNIQLGGIGNIHITGGANTQFIQTNGNGNLSYANGYFQTFENNIYTVVNLPNESAVPTSLPQILTGATSVVYPGQLYLFTATSWTLATVATPIDSSIIIDGDASADFAAGDFVKMALPDTGDDTGIYEVSSVSYNSGTDQTEVVFTSNIISTASFAIGDPVSIQGAPVIAAGDEIAFTPNGTVYTVVSVGVYDAGQSGCTLQWNTAATTTTGPGNPILTYAATVPSNMQFLSVGGGLTANVDVANATLTLSTVQPSNIANGTSNVTIPAANGNVNFNVNGNAIANVNANGIAAIGVNVGPFSANATTVTLGNVRSSAASNRVFVSGANTGQILGVLANGAVYALDRSIQVINGYTTGFANTSNAFVSNAVTSNPSGSSSTILVTSPNATANISSLFPIDTRIQFSLDANGNTVSNNYYNIAAITTPNANSSVITIQPGLLSNLVANSVMLRATIQNVKTLQSGNNINIIAPTQLYTSIGKIEVTPSGNDTQLQYNANGALGASANLAFDYSNNILSTVTANLTGNLTANNANISNNARVNATLTLPANSNLSFSGNTATFSNLANVKIGGTQAAEQVITTDGATNLRFANAQLYTGVPATYTSITGSVAPAPATPTLATASLFNNTQVDIAGDWSVYVNTGYSLLVDATSATTIYVGFGDATGTFVTNRVIRFGGASGNVTQVVSSTYQTTYTNTLSAAVTSGSTSISLTAVNGLVQPGQVITGQNDTAQEIFDTGTTIASVDYNTGEITLDLPTINDAQSGDSISIAVDGTEVNVDVALPVTEVAATIAYVNQGSQIQTGLSPVYALSTTGTPFTFASYTGYNPVSNVSSYFTGATSAGNHPIGSELFFFGAASTTRFEKIVAGSGITMAASGSPSTLTITANVAAIVGDQSQISNGNSNVRIAANANVTISSNGQANIFNISSNGAHAQTTIQDDVTVTGNLNISGNTNFTNVNELAITNPLIQLGIYGNDSPLVTDDGKDRGIVSHIFGANLVTTSSGSTASGNTIIVLTSVAGAANGQAVFANDANNNPVFPADAVVSNVDVANTRITVSNATVNVMATGTQVVLGSDRLEFLGWKSANNEFQTRANVTQSDQIISGGSYANLRTNYLKGNVYNDTANLTLGANGNSNVVSITNTQVSTSANVAVNGNLILQGNNNQLGSNAYIHITGGNSNQFLKTNGNGNLAWSDGTLHYSNGQSNTNSGFVSGTSSESLPLVVVVGDVFNYTSTTAAVTLAQSGTTLWLNGNYSNISTQFYIPMKYAVGNSQNQYIFYEEYASGNNQTRFTLSGGANAAINAGNTVYVGIISAGFAANSKITVGTDPNVYTITQTPFYWASNNNTAVPLNSGNISDVITPGTAIYWVVLPTYTYFSDLASGNNIEFTYDSGNSRLTIASNAQPNTIFNGNSNVVVAANSNVTVSVAGNANVVTVTGNGITGGVGKTLTLQSNNGSSNRSITIKTSTDANFNANYTLTLPTTDGNAGQILATDGTGVLSWADGTSLSNGSSNITIDASEAIRFSANGLANVLTLNNNQANFSPAIVNIDSQGYTGWVDADATANYDRGLFLGNVNTQTANTATTYPIGTSNIALNVTGAVTENWTTFNVGDKFYINSDTANVYTVSYAYEKYLEFVPNSTTTIANNAAINSLTNFFGYKGSQNEFVAIQQGNISNNQVSTDAYANLRAGTFKGAVAANTITANDTVTLSNAVNISGNLNFTGPNAYFSNVSQLHIPGGGSNYFLRTDGSGGLSWSYISPVSASIPNVHFNVTVAGNNQSFSNTVLEAYPANTDMVVFRNGSLLTTDNYLLDNPGGVLTINVPLLASDNIDIIRQGLITISDSILIANYAAIPTIEFIAAANGNNQTFSNSFLLYYSSNLDMNLFVNGALQQTDTYTLNTVTGVLTFNLPLTTGDSIIIPNKLANISNIANGVAGSNTEVLFNDGDTVNASPSFTFNKTSNTVSVVNLNANGTANLGAVANVRVTGGTNGQYIKTDGAGNLSFGDISTSSISNGNSNVRVFANGNVTISANGQANIVTIFTQGSTSTVAVADGMVVGGELLANTLRTDEQGSNGYVQIATASEIIGTSVIQVNTVANTANFAGAVNANGNLRANGTLTATGNANVANLLVNGDANITGNLTLGGTFNVAGISNGNSNVRVFGNSDVTVSTNGVANVTTVYANGATGMLTNAAQPLLVATANSVATVSGGNVQNAAVRFDTQNVYIGGASGSSLGNMKVTYQDSWRLANPTDATNANGNTGAMGFSGGISVAKTVYAGNIDTTNASLSGNATVTGNITSNGSVTANTLNVVGTGSLGTGGDSTINGNLTLGNASFQQGGGLTASSVTANSVTNREQGQSGAVQISAYNHTVGTNNFVINNGTYNANLAGNLTLYTNTGNFNGALRSSGVGAGAKDFTVVAAYDGIAPPVWIAIGGSAVSVSNDGNSWWSAAANGGFNRPVSFSSQWQSVGRGNTNGNTIAIIASDAQLWYSNNRANTWYQSNYALFGATRIRGSLTGQFVAVGANGNIMVPETYATLSGNWDSVVNLGSGVTFNDVATNDNGVWVAQGYYTANGTGVLYRSVDDANTWSIDTRANTAWPAYANYGISVTYDDWNANANTFIVMGGRSQANTGNFEIRTTRWNGTTWSDTIANANTSGDPFSVTGITGAVRWLTSGGTNYYLMTSNGGHAVLQTDTSQAPFTYVGSRYSTGSDELGNIMRLTGATGSQFTSTAFVTIGTLSNTYISQAFDANLTVAGAISGNSLTLPGITLGGNNFSVAGNGSFGGNLSVGLDTVIGGNLTVLGNAIYNDTTSLLIQDPVIELAIGNNDTVLTSPDDYDRGILMHNYGNGFTKTTSANVVVGSTTIPIANTVGIVAGMNIGTPNLSNTFNHLSTVVTVNTNSNVIISNAVLANFPSGTTLAIGNDKLHFMGWDTSSNEFTFGSNVSILNDVITYNEYGTLRFDEANANVVGNGNANIAFTGTTVTLQANTSNISLSNDSFIALNPNGSANVVRIFGNTDTYDGSLVTVGQSNAFIDFISIGNSSVNVALIARGGISGDRVKLYFETDGNFKLGNGTTDQMFSVSNDDIVRVGSIIDAANASGRSGAFSVAGGVSVAKTLYANAVNVTADLSANNANIGNSLVVGTTIQANGNITGNANIIGNFVGNVYAGNSNVRLLANSNVSISANGNANIIVVEGGTTSNVYISGNLGVNANIIGNFVGNLYNGTSNVRLAANGDVSISANGAANIIQANGNYDTFGSSRIALGQANAYIVVDGLGNASVNAAFLYRGGVVGDKVRMYWESNGGLQLGNGTTDNMFTIDPNNITRVGSSEDSTSANGRSGAFSVAGGISANKSVYVGGNLQVTGDVTAKGVANGVQYRNSGNLNSTANFTFDGSNLVFAGARANLGNVSNLFILGAASNGQLLSADINGNLAFVDASSVDKIANGTSNIYMPAANGNAYVTINGNANIVTFYDSGVKIGNAANAAISTTISEGNITTGGSANIGNTSNTAVLTTISSGNITTGANLYVGNSSNANVYTTITQGNIYTGGNVIVGNLVSTAAVNNSQMAVWSTGTSMALAVGSNSSNATLQFITGNGTGAFGQTLDVGTEVSNAAQFASRLRVLSTTNATDSSTGAVVFSANLANLQLSTAFGNGNAYIGGSLQVGVQTASLAQSAAVARIYSTVNATAANVGAVVVTSNIANADLSVATGNGNVFVGGSATLGRVTTNLAQTNSNLMIYSNVDVTDTQTGAITVTSNNANAQLSTAIGNGKMFTGLGVQTGYTSASEAVSAATLWTFSNLNATTSNSSGAFRLTSNTADANLSIAMGNGNAIFGTSVRVGNSTVGGAGVNSANLRVLSNVNATAPATGAFVVAGNTANANLAVAIGNGNAYVGGNIIVGTLSTNDAVNSSNVTVYSNIDATNSATGAVIITSNNANANLSTAIGNGKVYTGLAVQVGSISANVAQSAGNIILYSNVNATAPNVGAFITSGNIGNSNLTISMGNGNAYVGGNLEIGTASANLGAAVNSSRLYIYSNINAANLSTAGLGAFTIGGNLSNANLTTTIGNGNVYTGGNLQVGTGLNSDANAAVNASELLVISNINATTSTGAFIVTGNIANANLTSTMGNGNIRTGTNLIVGAGLNSDANAAVASSKLTVHSNVNSNSSILGGFTVTGNIASPLLSTSIGNGNISTGGMLILGNVSDAANLTYLSTRNTTGPGGSSTNYSLWYGGNNVSEFRMGGNAVNPVFTFGTMGTAGTISVGNVGFALAGSNVGNATITAIANEANANITLNAKGSGNVIVPTGNLRVTRGSNVTVSTDEYIVMGGNNAGSVGAPVVFGIQSSNTTYSGMRWSKAAGTEVVFMGLDNTGNVGNFRINANGTNPLTIWTGNSSATNYNTVSETKGFAEYYANQASISNGTDTRLTGFNVQTTDTTGFDYTNGIWTNNTGKTVQVILAIQSAWQANATGARIHWAQINSTGSTSSARYAMVDTSFTPSPEASVITTSAPIQLTNGSNLSIWVYQTSSTTLTYSGTYAGMQANASSRITLVVL